MLIVFIEKMHPKIKEQLMSTVFIWSLQPD